MTDKTWINGQQAHLVDATDRGLQYGDGLFETIAVFEGQPQLIQNHLARVGRDLIRLGFPGIDMAEFEREIRQAASTMSKGVLKALVTRGSAPRGYRPPAHPQPTRIIYTSAWPAWSRNVASAGVRVRVCSQQLAIQPALAGIKHLNRLEQVLARAEWSDPDIAEGLMLDTEDRVVCGTMSNLYLVRGRTVLTPVLHRCGVWGVMREQVQLASAALGLGWEEADLVMQDVMTADELLLSNALAGLWQVRELDGREFASGKICAALRIGLAGLGVRQCDAS